MASDERSEDPPPTDAPADTVIQDLPPQDGSSDGERDERTAREKLKKTSIAGLAQYSKVSKATGDHPLGEVANADTTSDAQSDNGQARGRPSKKRSFDDLQNEESGPSVENGGAPLPKKGAQHKRMRSREIPEPAGEAQKGLDINEDMASPVQEESDADAQQSPGGPGVLVSAPSKEEMDAAASAPTTDVEDTTAADTLPNVTAISDEKPATATTGAPPSEQGSKTQIPASSGFANASSASPFASFKSPKSPENSTESSTQHSSSTTSTSAFASSGLSAFASSEKSPFGTVGSTAKNSGGFGGATTSAGFGSSSGGFAAASPFGSKPASGFGAGGGFGSAGGFGGGSGFGATSKPFAGGLSSFGSPSGGVGTFAIAKPFGSKNDQDDDEKRSDEGGDEEEGASQAEEDPSQDPRFHQQELNTGEEEEETIFTCTAKLYHFEKEWKESGVGDFKINIRYEVRSTPAAESSTEEDAAKDDENNEQDLEAGRSESSSRLERKARLIMRARGTHRLVLNTPVFKEMIVGTADGKEPTGKTMHLTGLEGGKPTGYQMKASSRDPYKG
ncbi:hypothetical protein A1O7_05547 [Cladophialophora yegresii CBS 114405]|uniref:RanBD1 domain-containing protein n=1 Tax=Cladophialophora yegresii CBS 114405 TaxID=1182544 RepID=W9VRE1_9EURO|nr:uncharacterized protein A1O7_05547 [Cladophialophora yegresii CBS 114405]EXJ58123.1 hypothetical protein A1O7_05547 [Cladophialophora yegresii CBS 114405]